VHALGSPFLAAIDRPLVVVLLIVCGLAGIVIELHAPGGFVAGILGGIALAAGLVGLERLPAGDARTTAALLAAAAFAASGGAVWLVRRHRRRVPPRSAGLLGHAGRTRGTVGPDGGLVIVDGEIWAACTWDGTEVPPGTPVLVVRVHDDDLMLTVERREEMTAWRQRG
jgi:membrane-bound ClpP family serine protease